jgi:signal peptidase II
MSTKYRIFFPLALCIVFLDQITKMWVVAEIPYGKGIPLINNFFTLVHYRNTGAAFGLFSDSSSMWRDPFFFTIGAVVLGVILYYLKKSDSRERYLSVIFGLLAGGILGNIIDRIRFGNVVDFLSFHIGHEIIDTTIFGVHFNFPLEWPAFNVADSAITIAMLLSIYYILIIEPKKGSVSQ